MLAFAKLFSILVTMAGGLLAIFGKTTTTNPSGKSKLTWIGWLSFAVVLLGGLASYLSDRADKAAAAAAIRIDKEWDELQSRPIAEIIVEVVARGSNLKVADLEDVSTKVSLQVTRIENQESRTVRVASDPSQNNPEKRFSLSIAGDGLKEVLHTKPGKLWTQYPGSKQWLCYWSIRRPQPTQETWACSLELSVDDPGDIQLKTLHDLDELAFLKISVPSDFHYEARLYSEQPAISALFSIRVGDFFFDISPTDDEWEEHVDETKAPPLKHEEAKLTGNELLWRLRSQFEANGGMSGASEPKPFWWRAQFQLADWLVDFLPSWLSGHLPDLYPKPPQVVEGQWVGRPVNLSGYYPRPPNPQERAAYQKWIADQSASENAK